MDHFPDGIRDGSVDPAFSDPGDMRGFVEVIQDILAGKIRLPVVYKPNFSGEGLGIFFLTRERPGEITITMSATGPDYLGQLGIPEVVHNRRTDLLRLTLSTQRHDVIGILHHLWREISYRAFLIEREGQGEEKWVIHDPGMMEATMQTLRFEGRAYETRHLLEGNPFTGDATVMRDEWRGKVGSSSIFANQIDRSASATWLDGEEMFHPLCAQYSKPHRRVFLRYVDRMLRAEFRYFSLRLRAAGIEFDQTIRSAFDLMWLPSSGHFPQPLLIEAVFIPINQQDPTGRIPNA